MCLGGCSGWAAAHALRPGCTHSEITMWNCPVFTLLHFAWGVAEAKCILVTAVCVCLSVCLSACLSVSLSLTAFPHYCTDPDVAWGMAGLPLSCALLGGFAICALVSLLWQHSAEREMSASACTHSVPGLIYRPGVGLTLLNNVMRSASDFWLQANFAVFLALIKTCRPVEWSSLYWPITVFRPT